MPTFTITHEQASARHRMQGFALDAAQGKALYVREFIDYAERAYQAAKDSGADADTLRQIAGSLHDGASALIGGVRQILDNEGLTEDLVTFDMSDLDRICREVK